jgi:hypothetical protein
VNKTIIEIGDSVTPEQRNDPRFKKLLQDCEGTFNASDSDLFKLLIALHEAGHGYFARKSGATKIRYFGPKMVWNSRYNRPEIHRSSTEWTPAAGRSTVLQIKPQIAGFICRRELSGFPNDEVAIKIDVELCRDWFDKHVGTGEGAFNAVLRDAEREILVDLRSPKTRREIWGEARRFDDEIFPKVKANAVKQNGASSVWQGRG